MDKLEAIKQAHRVRMLICNKMYEHAYQRIIELTKLKIYVTVNDDGYNEWKKKQFGVE